jgi:hypothetical protein
MYLFCHFSPYSTIFQLYDGGQSLLVEERTQIHYITDKLSHTVTSVQAGFKPTKCKCADDKGNAVLPFLCSPKSFRGAYCRCCVRLSFHLSVCLSV